MTLDAIQDIRFKKPEPAANADRGAEPVLCWLPVSALGIDFSYQRDVLENGRSNVRRIIENFRWSHFAPLVVARRADGRYAVIDGQHRAIAAKAMGLPRVPCSIVACGVEEEAGAFASINGDVTKPNAMQIYAAKLAAGDKTARQLREVCDAACVKIPRNIIAVSKPGETLAIGALQSCLRTHGKDVLLLALRCVIATAANGNAGLLRASIIHGFCDCLACRPGWRKAEARLLAAVEEIGVRKLYQTAERIRAVDGGSGRAVFCAQVLGRVEPLMLGQAGATVAARHRSALAEHHE